MPYYRHLKTEQPEDGEEFNDPSRARRDMDPKTHTVTFVASEYEKETWRSREQWKFHAGDYASVPWITKIRGVYRRYDLPDSVRDHYPHLSAKFPGLIAYTKSEEHGVLNRQTAVKPGKYIEEYLKDSFTPDQVANYIAACKSDALTLQIARTEDDIVAIYSQKDCGFTSCMQSKGSPEYAWQRPTEAGDRLHPVAVYGDSDLGVAYLGDIQTKIKARAVVWPDQKVYTRIYGDINTLKHVLRANGYTEGSLTDARVRKLTGPKGIIMPYIDGLTNASESECHKWIVLDNKGPLACDNTEGYAKSVCDREYDDDDDEGGGEDSICDNCNDSYDFHESHNGRLNFMWCDDCITASEVCQVCNTRRWGQDWQRIAGMQTCDSCQEGMTSTCEHEVPRLRSVSTGGLGLDSCGETWIEALAFTVLERGTRARLGVSHLCRACAEHKQACKACDSLFDSEAPQCETCGHAVYCGQTGDLLDFSHTAPQDAISRSWLPVGADGSLWWKGSPSATRHLPVGHWVKFTDGRTCYTEDCGQAYSESTFDTLDDSLEFVRVSDPRRAIPWPRVTETHNTLGNALRDSQWEYLNRETCCHIHDCPNVMHPGDLGLRASFDDARGNPVYYCGTCVSTRCARSADAHAFTLPSALVPFIANESSPF